MIDGNFIINNRLVEPRLGRLSGKGNTVHLEPQVMKVLVYLASRPREVVTKEQLIDALWSGAIVGDAALARCISQIRLAFGDSAKNASVIETVPKIGYRLIATVGDAVPERSRRTRYRWAMAAVALFILVSLGQSVGLVQPTHVSIVNQTAQEAYASGRRLFEKYTYPHNQNAIALFEQALEMDPRFGLAYAGLADALMQQAQFWGGDGIDEARELAERAIELEPGRAESHTAMGTALALSGDDEGALEAYGRALQIDPDYWQAAYSSANVNFWRQDFAKAETLYLHTLRLTPRNDIAMSNLGYLYLKSGNVEAARTWLSRALQQLPMQAQAASRLAMLEMLTGYPDEALSRCSRINEAFPGHYACLQVMAVGSLMKRDLPEALQRFETVVEEFPDDRYARLGQAQVLLAESKQDEAMELVDRVLEQTRRKVGEGDVEAYDYWLIAGCHTLRGEDSVAYEWFDKAAQAGRRFHLWDASDPLFATLHGDSRFDRYIASTKVAMP